MRIRCFICIMLAAVFVACNASSILNGGDFLTLQGQSSSRIVSSDSGSYSDVNAEKISSNILPSSPKEKSYDEFLEAILVRESDVDPTQAARYAWEFANLEIIVDDYAVVEYPGRVVRNNAGGYPTQKVNRGGLFWSIGVLDLYDPQSEDQFAMLKNMQYNVINFLGFIGYQFSESDLYVLGYYNYAIDEKGRPMYYIDIDTSHWANGVRDFIKPNVLQPDGREITVHVTDVNRWGGTFTGKNGINSLEDFKSSKADSIAKDHFAYKYNNIVKDLKKVKRTINEFIGTQLRWDELNPPLPPPPGFPETVTVTYSGLLAAAHLRGAQGVYDLLIDHYNDQDEAKTAILSYVYTFAGYQTPWGPHSE